MKNFIICVIAVLVICTVVVLTMSGCAKKYNVDYMGSKDLFENAKQSYKAGERVTLYYPYVAMDVDYSFYLDGESINSSYDDEHGISISFVMPEHDVTLSVVTRNSMVYEP